MYNLILYKSNKLDNFTILSARKMLNKYKENFKLPTNFNSEEFRLVANGFFQAEGHVSCRIKGKYFSPVVVINQNLSNKSLEFFVTLWYALGQKGTLGLTINKHGKLVIRLSSESWDTVLNIYFKYFDSIYGEKYMAFKKLFDIRRLTQNKFDLDSMASATYLVYSLSNSGVDRKLSLSDQLKLFSVSNDLMLVEDLNENQLNVENYSDNNTSLSMLFIIGFILGDGTLFLRLRYTDKGSIWLIPTLFLPQLKNKYNAHFFTLLESFFTSLNIKTYIKNKINDAEIVDILPANTENTKMTVLVVEGLTSVFKILLPLIYSYSHYFYWKYDQYELMFRVSRLVEAKAHLTLYGFTSIIEIIYSYSNKRIKNKEFYLSAIRFWFKSQAVLNKSGENNIQAIFSKGPINKKIVGWKCVFPNESNLKPKQFGVSNSKDIDKSLQQAKLYRDINIKLWVESLCS